MSDNLPYDEQEKLLADAIKYKEEHPTVSLPLPTSPIQGQEGQNQPTL